MRRLLRVLHYRQKSKRLTFSHFWYFPKHIFSLDGSSSQSESLPGLGALFHGFRMIRSDEDYQISAGLLGHMISTILVAIDRFYDSFDMTHTVLVIPYESRRPWRNDYVIIFLLRYHYQQWRNDFSVIWFTLHGQYDMNHMINCDYDVMITW